MIAPGTPLTPSCRCCARPPKRKNTKQGYSATKNVSQGLRLMMTANEKHPPGIASGLLETPSGWPSPHPGELGQVGSLSLSHPISPQGQNFSTSLDRAPGGDGANHDASHESCALDSITTNRPSGRNRCEQHTAASPGPLSELRRMSDSDAKGHTAWQGMRAKSVRKDAAPPLA